MKSESKTSLSSQMSRQRWTFGPIFSSCGWGFSFPFPTTKFWHLSIQWQGPCPGLLITLHLETGIMLWLFIKLPWGVASPPWFRSWTCPRARHSCASLNAGQCRSPSRTTPASAQSSPEEEAFSEIFLIKRTQNTFFMTLIQHLAIL